MRSVVVPLALALAGCGSDPSPEPPSPKRPVDNRAVVVWDGFVFHCARPNDCRGTIGGTLEVQGVQDKTLVSIGKEPPVTTTVAGASIPLTIASFADADPTRMAGADDKAVLKLPLAITTGDTVLYTTGAPVLWRTAAAIVDAGLVGAKLPVTGKAIWIAASAWGGGAIGLAGAPATKVTDLDRVVVRPDATKCEVVLVARVDGKELARAPVCERAAIVAWATQQR